MFLRGFSYRALAHLRGPVVVARLEAVVAVHVELANMRRAVAGLVQGRHHRRQLLIPPGLVVVDAVSVRVEPRQVAGPAGRAQRHGHEGVREQHALAPDAVDVRGLHEWIAGDAERGVALIVGQQKEEVRPEEVRRRRGANEGSKGRAQRHGARLAQKAPARDGVRHTNDSYHFRRRNREASQLRGPGVWVRPARGLTTGPPQMATPVFSKALRKL